MSDIIINETRTDIHKAITWCIKEFGAGSVDINAQWPGHTWLFKFKNSEQACHFALKWAK